jgi:hypothetical protein
VNILLISWYFPPANDVGALRIGKIADYLLQQGNKVQVLTSIRAHCDNSLGTVLTQDQITRTHWFDVDTFRSRTERNVTIDPGKVLELQSSRSETKHNAFRSLAAEHYRHLVRIPDQQTGWLPYLRKAARTILAKEKFDLIYASGPPFTVFLGASAVSRECGVPWIAEYRDAWSRYVYAPKPRWKQLLDEHMENRALAKASGIVTTSEPWADYYRVRFGKPTVAVSNGYDADQVQDQLLPPKSRESPLSITYMGVMYGGLRDPSCLYEALRLSGLSPKDVQILFHGPEPKDILPLAERYGVVEYVQICGRVSYRESLMRQRQSDVLLLLQSPEDPRNIPAKTFEYLAMKRPILGLGLDDGVPATIVRKSGAGIYITDPTLVAHQLQMWVKEKRRSGWVSDLSESVREPYSRLEQLKHLESFLHSRLETNSPETNSQATQSFLSRQEFQVANINSQRPLLVTTVDAEESFDWSRPLTRDATCVSAMNEQHTCHRIFQKFGITPVYFVTHPVVLQPDGSVFLQELLRDRKCEVGAQLHSWVTPPFEETVNLHNSFAGNLPDELEFRKLETLTHAIGERFGIRPTAYRAGRYGIGPNTVGMLRKLGYLIDSSVVPEQSYKHEGGPEFFGLPTSPFWLDEANRILELPLTSSYVGQLARKASGLSRNLFSNGRKHALARSLAARTGILERIRLTPEGTDIKSAKRLVRHLLQRGTTVFTLSYHAPSLVPGSTPYVQSQKDLLRFLRWLEEFCDFFVGELGGVPATASEIHALALRGERAREVQPAPRGANE